MKLTELMKDITLNPEFTGIATADNYVLAVGLVGDETDPGDYLVAQDGITEHSGTLTAKLTENSYIRAGAQNSKIATTRTITVTGERYIGDEFQDALLAHPIKFGTAQSVVKPYVYFNMITGKGEKGFVSIVVDEDPSGAAGANAGIKATMTAKGTPAEYSYVKAAV